ncbi:hypothetical protein CMEL01_11865 [Colletotrichum melonis]|uniref:Uncharacterized protein n=1 Tax=Colletotrichum melonis TaxID=1209925 RepID=A0AAI9UYI4_9PEZI|nr:hypothetical protein CMEL01_11865 [Colletotrichum melonis]
MRVSRHLGSLDSLTAQEKRSLQLSAWLVPTQYSANINVIYTDIDKSHDTVNFARKPLHIEVKELTLPVPFTHRASNQFVLLTTNPVHNTILLISARSRFSEARQPAIDLQMSKSSSAPTIPVFPSRLNGMHDRAPHFISNCHTLPLVAVETTRMSTQLAMLLFWCSEYRHEPYDVFLGSPSGSKHRPVYCGKLEAKGKIQKPMPYSGWLGLRGGDCHVARQATRKFEHDVSRALVIRRIWGWAHLGLG